MPAATPPICDFGLEAPDFSLPDAHDNLHHFRDLIGEKGTLVMFICNHCPYVLSVIGRIVETVEKLQENGIGVVAIMANDWQSYPDDSPEKMVTFGKDHKINFPYLVDETQKVAKAFDAVCTPDFFGYNSVGKLQYRGRLDESKTTLAKGVRNDLLDAMMQVAITGQGPEEQISSMGCSIKWR